MNIDLVVSRPRDRSNDAQSPQRVSSPRAFRHIRYVPILQREPDARISPWSEAYRH